MNLSASVVAAAYWPLRVNMEKAVFVAKKAEMPTKKRTVAAKQREVADYGDGLRPDGEDDNPAGGVMVVISGLLQVALIAKAVTVSITMAEATANDARQRLIGVFEIVLLIGAAVTFLVWFHRVDKNLSALGGRDLKYTPGWAMGGFFVPFLNLVRPSQVNMARQRPVRP